MKVGISVTPLYNLQRTPQKIDGIGTYTANLSRALAQQKVQVEEIYFKRLKESFRANPPTNEGFSVAQNWLYSFCPGTFCHLGKDDLDILHITDHLTPRVKDIPVISTIHDAIMLKPEWSQSSSYLHYVKKFLLTQMNRRVDGVITVSHAAVADIVDFWKIPEHKISVAYHGIADEWHQRINPQTREIILKKYQLTKPFFLTVGTLQPRKNLARIINAYLALPKRIQGNFDLVIVGKQHPGLTPEPLLAQLKQMAAKRQLFWLEYVPFTDLLGLYQSAYALLYPSLAEGFGFPIIEGFASATPVITSNFGSMAEIGGQAAYLVDPNSEEAIGAAMTELVEKSDVRDQFIRQGLARAQLFTWEKCATQTLSIYKKFT